MMVYHNLNRLKLWLTGLGDDLRPAPLGAAPALALLLATSGCFLVPEDEALPVPTPTPAPEVLPIEYEGFEGATEAETVGDTKVKIKWNASDDGDVVAYNIYDSTGVFDVQLVKSVRAPGDYVTLTGLEPGTYYMFRVRAADDDSTEDNNTNDVEAITYGGVLTSEVLTSTTARLTYSDASNADQVNVYCKTDDQAEYQLVSEIEDVDQTQVTLTGLSAGETYTCRVALVINEFIDNNTVTTGFIPMGEASQLVFSSQPGGAMAGVALSPAPIVTIMDTNNNIVVAGPDSTALITLSLSAVSPTLGTVRGTAATAAVNGIADFSSLGINFQEAGTKIITATKADTTSEERGTPTLSVDSNSLTITAGSVSPSLSTISVSPDDQTRTADGNESFTVTITLSDQYGNAISGVKPTFASTNSADTITQPTAFTDASGQTTGSIKTTVAGTKTLNISSPSGLTGVETTATFTHGAATKVAFTQQPVNTPSGPAAMADLIVAIQDQRGNTVTSGSAATSDVTLAIFTNPGNGTLTGTTTVAAVNGVATFGDLGINKTGTGYKLVANTTGLTVAYSNSFNVTSGVPSRIAVSGPSSVLSGTCSTAYTFQLQDWENNPSAASANTPVTLSGLGNASLYTSNTCSQALTSSTITFASGSHTKTYYLKDNTGQALTVTATDPAAVMSQGTKAVKIDPSQVGLAGPEEVASGRCSEAFTITTSGADSEASNAWVDTIVQISGLTGTGASLHSDVNCATAALNPSSITLSGYTNLTTIYLKDNTSEEFSLTITDPLGQMATSTSSLDFAVRASQINLTGPSTVVSGDCSTAFTVSLKDAAGNAVLAPTEKLLTIEGIDGTQAAFYSSNVCAGASLGTTIAISEGASSTMIYLKDNAAEAIGVSISDPETDPSLTLDTSQTVNVTISPSTLALTGPNSSNTNVCSTAFTINTKDGANNVAAAITPITVNLGGAGTGGAFYSDSDCATEITQIIFSAGQSVKTIYFMGLAPATTTPLTLTATDAASILDPASKTFTVNAGIAWIGTRGEFSWFQPNTIAVTSRGEAQSAGAYALHFDSTKRYLYVADYYNSRIHKFDYQEQQYIGWVGNYNNNTLSLPFTGSGVSEAVAAQCVAMGSSGTTPGWCTGGMSNVARQVPLGYNPNPLAITDDGTHIYVANGSNAQGVSRYNATTGAFEGWIGRVHSNAGMTSGTGLTNTCSTTAAGYATPGWCIGGVQANNWTSSELTYYKQYQGDGGITLPQALAYGSVDGTGYLFVGTEGAVLRFDAETGTFMGWVGKVGATNTSSGPNIPPTQIPLDSAPGLSNTCATTGVGQGTPGWCKGGQFSYDSATVRTLGAVTYATGMYADSTNGILYVVIPDANGTISKYDMATGTWLGNLGASINAAITSPYHITSDDAGHLYLATANRLLEITLNEDGSGYISGWIGKVGNPAPSSPAACQLVQTYGTTPGWCLGGSAIAGIEERAFHYLTGVELDAEGYLLTGQGRYFPSIKKWDSATGDYVGTMGFAPTSPERWTTDTSLASYQGFDDQSFYYPEGVAISGNNLFVAEMYNERIKKINKSTGEVLGWIGGMATTPTGGDAGCIGANPMALTPGWCLGTLPNVYGYAHNLWLDGTLYSPKGMTTDGTYLYVAGYDPSRIQKYKISDGSYIGWIGRVSQVPSSAGTGLTNTCSTTSSGSATPGWCKGGTSQTGTGDGAFYYPSGIYHYQGKLYVLDFSNHRITKHNAETGAFEGWIGKIGGTRPTSGCTAATNGALASSGGGWCIGGVSTASASGAAPGGQFYFAYAAGGITGYGNYLYISNANNSRIDKIDLDGNYDKSLRSRWDSSYTWNTDPTTWGNETYRPTGLWTDGTYLYVIGEAARILKRDLATGALLSWRGAIRSGYTASGGESGCQGAIGVTPGWCTGNDNVSADGTYIRGYRIGRFAYAYFITGDSDFIYVSDEDTNRVTRMPK